MQVRSLNVKTTEILQLELSLKGEAERLLDEIDALMFSLCNSSISTFQVKAIRFRLKTLTQLGGMLPHGKEFARDVIKLQSFCEGLFEGLYTSTKYAMAAMECVRRHTRPDSYGSDTDTDTDTPRVASTAAPFLGKTPHRPDKDTKPLTTRTREPTSQHPPKESFPDSARASENIKITLQKVSALMRTELKNRADRTERLECISSLLLTLTSELSPKNKLQHFDQIDRNGTISNASILIVQCGECDIGIPLSRVMDISMPLKTIHQRSGDSWENDTYFHFSKDCESHLPSYSLATILSCAESSSLSPISLTLTSDRGDFILKTFTEGRITDLYLETNQTPLHVLEIFSGAAIDYTHHEVSSSKPLLILDINALGALLQKTLMGLKPLSRKPTLPLKSPKQNLAITAKTFAGQTIAVPLFGIVSLKQIEKKSIIFREEEIFTIQNKKIFPALDPDQFLNKKSKNLDELPEVVDAFVLTSAKGPTYLLVAKILDQGHLGAVHTFGFPPPLGTSGVALCNEDIVLVIDPSNTPLTPSKDSVIN